MQAIQYCYTAGRNAWLSLVQIVSRGIRQISLLTIQLVNKFHLLTSLVNK